ncbi:uncharacterized protein LOC142769162 [Rhipicephalus microplus]|uniref:uncharacterized protein LOC142769162 n=1 Tax=Rhipicephalus microplus TaxID=6941 RepID=UPI003F6B1F48
MSSPHGGSSDSEPEDPSTTPKPSDSTPGPSANVEGKPSEQPEGSSIKEKLKKAGIVAGVALVAGAAAFASAPVALAAVGFTSSGVAAGSLAAAYQATLGGFIAKSSVLALLQSFGTAGIPAAVQTGIAAVAATGTGGVTALFQKVADWNREKGSEKGTNEENGSGETEAEATGEASEENDAKETEAASRPEIQKDNCTHNGIESKGSNVESRDVKSAENAEGQETCRQN